MRDFTLVKDMKPVCHQRRKQLDQGKRLYMYSIMKYTVGGSAFSHIFHN